MFRYICIKFHIKVMGLNDHLNTITGLPSTMPTIPIEAASSQQRISRCLCEHTGASGFAPGQWCQGHNASFTLTFWSQASYREEAKKVSLGYL